MKCLGVLSSEAHFEICVSGRDGLVSFIISATTEDRVGDRICKGVYCDKLTTIQAHAIAERLRQLVYGDISEFRLAGLSFEAGEYRGIEISLPYGCTVWLSEDADGLTLADELDKEAGE